MVKRNRLKNAYEDIALQHYYRGKPLSVFLLVLKNAGIVAGILTAATFISFGFRALGFHESNFIMTYILGVLLVAYFTDGYLYGIIASVLGVLVFNYFFTEPYYTLIAYSPEYPVTFIIMLIVALITNTLTARVIRESKRAEIREKRIHILYQIEKNLLGVKSKHQLLEVAAKDISELFGSSVLIWAADLNGNLSMRHVEGNADFEAEKEERACTEAFLSGMECGAGTELFRDCSAYYFPIMGQSGVLGVIGIAFPENNSLSDAKKFFFNTVGGQISLVLERERLYEKQQLSKMEIERERLRGDLLRLVSHDLKTPLTGILGSTSTILENYEILPDEIRKDFLKRIYEDAEWLTNLVENILSMTRFDEGNIKLKKEMEAVEEIVAAAVSHVRKRTAQHEISICIPEHLVMIPVDGTLIKQVLVNLLDNAVDHTPKGTIVTIAVSEEENDVVFEVRDNGPGIPEKELPFVFNRFYSGGDTGVGRRRGIGLGLAICKSIVEAHGGRITVHAPSEGTVFRFTLPARE